MKIVTAAEMRDIDRASSERFAVPSLTLMENAGTAVAEFALGRFPHADRITIVCGKGNNGGDGFVTARHLRRAGKEVTALLLAEPGELRGDAAEMFARMGFAPLLARNSEELKAEAVQNVLRADLLLDAILGTGFRPPVSPLYAEAIAALNASAAPVLSIDIPSGADADAHALDPAAPVCRADAVVTFTAPRPAHVFAHLTRGPVVLSPIGSPEEAIQSALGLEAITAREVAPVIPRRAPDAHKGDFGHALIIGGSLGKAGAAAMAGMAALRVGAGLVTVATAQSVLPTVAGFAPELMTEPLAETDLGSISMRALEYGRLDAIAKRKTVIAIGPGISRQAETSGFVQAVVAMHGSPCVIDADGLNAFEGCVDKLDGRRRPLVLTPHPGEMARLAGVATRDVQQDRIAVARRFAAERQALVVLKGHRTLIAEPGGRVWVNLTGNPGMASGGTGDVLTGMIAGFIAQNPGRVLEATLAGVYLHGLAGDVARNLVGEYSLVATDILAMLPLAFERVHDRAREKLVLLSE